MIVSIDPYLDRVPRKDYNCLSFVREVWLAMTGDDIQERLGRLLDSVTKTGKVSVSSVKGFEWLNEPVSPCFIVMQQYKFVPHVGIYLKGRILHMTERGVQYQPLLVARAYYTNIRYCR